jgi:hypothetical protein
MKDFDESNNQPAIIKYAEMYEFDLFAVLLFKLKISNIELKELVNRNHNRIKVNRFK